MEKKLTVGSLGLVLAEPLEGLVGAGQEVVVGELGDDLVDDGLVDAEDAGAAVVDGDALDGAPDQGLLLGGEAVGTLEGDGVPHLLDLGLAPLLAVRVVLDEVAGAVGRVDLEAELLGGPGAVGGLVPAEVVQQDRDGLGLGVHDGLERGVLVQLLRAVEPRADLVLHDVVVEAGVLDQRERVTDQLGVNHLDAGDGRRRVLGDAGGGGARGEGEEDGGLHVDWLTFSFIRRTKNNFFVR